MLIIIIIIIIITLLSLRAASMVAKASLEVVTNKISRQFLLFCSSNISKAWHWASNMDNHCIILLSFATRNFSALWILGISVEPPITVFYIVSFQTGINNNTGTEKRVYHKSITLQDWKRHVATPLPILTP